jgi:hypothetical protein
MATLPSRSQLPAKLSIVEDEALIHLPCGIDGWFQNTQPKLHYSQGNNHSNQSGYHTETNLATSRNI